MAELCTVCRRREPTNGQVCDPDLVMVDALLGDLPRKLRLLPLMLMPGQSPAGEKVTTTRVGSPTSARLDALSLVGPGAVPVPGALHPAVRKWSTTRTVEVEARVGVYRVDAHTTTITDWHQELVLDEGTGQPVMVPDDDQTGVLPPAEWLDQQVKVWQHILGHSMPATAHVRASAGPRPPRDIVAWVLAHGTPEQIATLFAMQDLTRKFRQGVTDLVVGHEPGHAGRRPVGLREDDPVADLWTLRFGEPALARTAVLNIRYLHAWLRTAAELDTVDMAGFVTQLRHLSAELTRVLGEQPDQQWLGRCPAQLTDKATGEKSSCGAGLWQDPHASVVECPRCHSAWGPRVVHLVHLAADIRRVWPLDRRRRYNAEEIDALLPLRCPGCGEPDVEIGWQEVTGVGDKLRWWRPTRTRCGNRAVPACSKASELL
jgi:hypothetical protein